MYAVYVPTDKNNIKSIVSFKFRIHLIYEVDMDSVYITQF